MTELGPSHNHANAMTRLTSTTLLISLFLSVGACRCAENVLVGIPDEDAGLGGGEGGGGGAGGGGAGGGAEGGGVGGGGVGGGVGGGGEFDGGLGGGEAMVPPNTWVATSLAGREGAAFAYDSARHRLVVFGGDTLPVLGDTWEFDGTHWVQRFPSTTPSPRKGHAMAYDAARQRMVLFGGMGNTVPFLSDTWEWDGETWTQRVPQTSPPARVFSAMAYDEIRQRIVLFGGSEISTKIADTWEWDGNNWTQLSPTTSPPERDSAHMTYDAARRAVVLFGGYGGAALTDTWEWNGTTWTEKTPATPSPTHWGGGLAYDAERERVVYFGGTNGNAAQAQTWEWDGAAWTQRTPATSPFARYLGGLAYDTLKKRIVLFGGSNDTLTNPRLSDLWEWDGSNWTPKSPAAPLAPPARYGHGLAYDTERERMVLFGGRLNDASTKFADTWEWNGQTWTEKSPAPTLQRPAKRYFHSLAYAAARKRTVLFGGQAENGAALSDTWEWDGTAWVERTPASSPSGRYGYALAYDSARERVVLFGGCTSLNGDCSVNLLGDTWEWDGNNWEARSVATAPPARAYHAMAYDSTRHRVVLFSGYLGPGSLPSDTWEWDGTTWVQLTPSVSPTGRYSSAMAYDVQRKRVILFSGTRLMSPYTPQDTWEWDGVNWQQRAPLASPPGRSHHALTYDAAHQHIVLFGGEYLSVQSFADTWYFNP